jgi:hypothetical protein
LFRGAHHQDTKTHTKTLWSRPQVASDKSERAVRKK